MLSRVPSGPLLFVLGILVSFVGIHFLLWGSGGRIISKRWAMLSGLIGGTVSALFGTGGPAYMGYLGHRLENRSELRATFSSLLVLDGGLRVVVFIAGGLFFRSLEFLMLIAVLPVMALGLYLGRCTHTTLSNRQMRGLTGILLLASGISLLLRGT